MKKAETELVSFQSGAAKVGTALNRMTDSFSGRKIVQEATLMAEVFKRAGGAATFTTEELQRMGTVGRQAMMKLQATGAPIPQQLQMMTTSALGATQGFGAMLGTVSKLAGAFGIAFGVGAVVNFGRSILTAADGLVKLRDKTGISLQGLQKFQIAGDDAGNTVDELAAAVNKMQNNLAGGDKSALSALVKMGVEFDKIRSLSPDQQFMAIGDAIKQIQNPADQVNLAMDVFGKTGAAVLPTLKRGFDDIKDAAVGMSDESIEAMDRFGDAITKMGRSLKAEAGNAIGWLANIQKRYEDFMETRFGMTDRPGGAQEPINWLTPEALAELRAPILMVNAAIGELNLSAAEEAEITKRLSMELDVLSAKHKIGAEARAKAKVASEQLAKAEAEAAKALRDFHNEIGVRFISDIEAANKATADAARALRAFNNEIGVREIQDIEHAAKATADLAAQMRALDNELGVLDMEARAHEFAFVGPIQDVLIQKTQTFGDSLDDLAGSLTQLAQVSGDSFGGIVKAMSQVVGVANVAVSAFQSISKAASEMGTNTASAIAGMASGYGALISMGIQAGMAFTAMSEEERRASAALWDFRKALIATMTEMQKLEASAHTVTLFGKERLDSEAASLIVVRDAYAALGLSAAQAAADVERFNASGSDNDRDVIQDNLDRLSEIEDAVHAMGAFTKAELQAVADQSKEVFEFMARAGTYSAEQLAEAWRLFERDQAIAMGEVAANTEAAFGDAAEAVDELQARFKTLSDQVAKEAPERHMGSIEKAARAEMKALESQMASQNKQIEADAKAAAEAAADALKWELHNLDLPDVHFNVIGHLKMPPVPPGPVPGPQPGPQNVSMPSTSGNSGGGGGGTAVLELDGQMLAKVLVPYIPGAIKKYGL